MNNNNKLTQRAEELDRISQSGISEILTFDEAQNIVFVMGKFLETTGTIRTLFGLDIPESFLPYPKHILVGALNKMAEFYHSQGNTEKVNVLESIRIGLLSYADDEEAVDEAHKQFRNSKWRDVFIPGLKRFQRNQMENGYLVDKQLWKFTKSRAEEIERSLGLE